MMRQPLFQWLQPAPVRFAVALLCVGLLLPVLQEPGQRTGGKTELRGPEDRHPPTLASTNATATGCPARRHYPHGQLQADLRTLFHMMRYVLAPEPPLTETYARAAV